MKKLYAGTPTHTPAQGSLRVSGSESGHVKGTAHPSPGAGPPRIRAVGREVKPHTWPEPSVGPAGFWLAQSSPQETSVELSSSRGQQPVHICAYGEAAPALHRKRLTLAPSAWTFPLGQVTVQAARNARHHRLNNPGALPNQPCSQEGLQQLFIL